MKEILILVIELYLQTVFSWQMGDIPKVYL